MLDLSMLPEGWVLIHSTTWNHFRSQDHNVKIVRGECRSLNPLYNVEPLQMILNLASMLVTRKDGS